MLSRTASRAVACLASINRHLVRQSSSTPKYEDYLSTISRRRKPSAIRALQPLLSIPGMISLGGGMPNPKTFPITSLQFTIEGQEVILLYPL